MTEADLTARFKERLEQSPGLVAWKLADGFTGGIPDLVFSWVGYTSWVEVKFLRPGDRIDHDLRLPRQLVSLNRLWKATGGRAWFLVVDERDPENERTVLVNPREMAAALTCGVLSPADAWRTWPRRFYAALPLLANRTHRREWQS